MPEPHYFDVVFSSAQPKTGWPRRFGVITAHNPLNRETPSDVNSTANENLKRALETDRRHHFPVTGSSPDGSHSEPGFGVVVEFPDDMRPYCRRFSQAAFYWVDEGNLYVIDAQSPTRHFIDRWDARQKA